MRLSLRLKFGLLLAGYVAALALILYLGYGAAQNVANDLSEVKQAEFPQFSEATQMQARFEQLARDMEDAATTGEEGLLERADTERRQFLERLVRLQAVTPEDQRGEIVSLRADFDDYYAKGRRHALFTNSSEGRRLASADPEELARRGAELSTDRKRLNTTLEWLVRSREEQLGV